MTLNVEQLNFEHMVAFYRTELLKIRDGDKFTHALRSHHTRRRLVLQVVLVRRGHGAELSPEALKIFEAES